MPKNTSMYPFKKPTNTLNKLLITAFSWLETVRFMYWNPAFHILKPCVSCIETVGLKGWNTVYHGLKHCVSGLETLRLKAWNSAYQGFGISEYISFFSLITYTK